jgi:hypothetical protein
MRAGTHANLIGFTPVKRAALSDHHRQERDEDNHTDHDGYQEGPIHTQARQTRQGGFRPIPGS